MDQGRRTAALYLIGQASRTQLLPPLDGASVIGKTPLRWITTYPRVLRGELELWLCSRRTRKFAVPPGVWGRAYKI